RPRRARHLGCAGEAGQAGLRLPRRRAARADLLAPRPCRVFGRCADRRRALVRGRRAGHGVALRTSGLLEAWQARLREYPEEWASARIEEAALPWGGFTPAGVLTLLRPGDRLATVEWIIDGALRVLRIVYALNRTWEPTTKRLAARVAALPVKPDRL